jgi:lambda family phage portal protein
VIKDIVDWAVSVISPSRGAARQYARQVERSYSGAVQSRLNTNKRPSNKSGDGELLGPWGADSVRALARMLVRDNPYAWSALESIIGEVLGTGIGFQSALETDMGEDEEDINEKRDSIFQQWCEVADINGQLTFNEMQILAFREMVEAGECLVRFHKVQKKHKGIIRPVPLALELIEADRLASDHDTYFASREGGIRIVRGVEQDETGKPIAYWIYPDHPNSPNTFARSPERIPATQMAHLFRKDRISQTRGVSWFAPVVGSTRDLGTYLDNEIQASTVASCFTAVITTERKIGQGPVSSGGEKTTNENGTPYQFMQPGLVLNLKPGEDAKSINPGRPNSAAGPWIELLLRGMAAGMGTSYEGVSKDFSQTSYSSSRTSKLENRPRFRRWQQYLMSHLCLRTWDEFCDAAAFAGIEDFPSMSDLLEDRRAAAPVELMPPVWEWVDITAEQAASERAINALQSSYAEELGGRGRSWRLTFYRRAKEEALKKSLGLVTPQDAMSQQAIGTGEQASANADKAQVEAGIQPNDATGELAGLSTMQFNRNRKAIDKVLNELASGDISEAKARVFLSGIGMRQENIDSLIVDASDGTVDELPQAQEAGT